MLIVLLRVEMSARRRIVLRMIPFRRIAVRIGRLFAW